MGIDAKDFFPTQYFVHTLLINGTKIHGVQTVNVSASYEVTNLTMKGLGVGIGLSNSVKGFNVRNFYKKPTMEVSFTKILGDNISSVFPANFKFFKTPPDPFEIRVGVVGGGGMKFKDMVLKSITYNFPNEGNFTEQLAYEGHMVEDLPELTETNYYTSNPNTWPEFTGTVKRRKDFNITGNTFPKEVAGLLFGQNEQAGKSGILLSVEASLNMNYGEIPTFGYFPSVRNKYISLPIDISCTYEVLDKGYKNQNNLFYNGYLVSGYSVGDYVEPQSIIIASYPTINLGTGNFLTNIDRSGGDAGQSDYSVYKYTYKNNDGSFIVS
jgi:hypothetical protein